MLTIAKVNAIAVKAADSCVLVAALITSAATAKRIQSTMKLGTAYLDVDFAVPPMSALPFDFNRSRALGGNPHVL